MTTDVPCRDGSGPGAGDGPRRVRLAWLLLAALALAGLLASALLARHLIPVPHGYPRSAVAATPVPELPGLH